MKKLSSLLLVHLLFLTNFLFAQTKEINYMNQSGPVSDQGDNGTCYAHSAEQLLRFQYRNLHPRGFVEEEIALSFGESFTASVDELLGLKYGDYGGAAGGYTWAAIIYSYGPTELNTPWKGLCEKPIYNNSQETEYSIHKHLVGFFPTGREIIHEVLSDAILNRQEIERKLERYQLGITRLLIRNTDEFMRWCLREMDSVHGNLQADCEKLFELVKYNLRNLKIFKSESELRDFVKYFYGYIKKTRADLSKYFFNNPKIYNLDEERIDFNYVRIVNNLMRAFYNNTCTPYEKPLPKYHDIAVLSADMVAGSSKKKKEKLYSDFIENFLSKGKLISLSYEVNGVTVPSDSDNLGQLHGVTIVGAKTMEGKRYYLAKNSYGKFWVPDSKGLKAKAVRNPNFNSSKKEDYSANRKLIGGYFWFPKDLLGEDGRINDLSAITDKAWVMPRGGLRLGEKSNNEDTPLKTDSYDSEISYGHSSEKEKSVYEPKQYGTDSSLEKAEHVY